MYKKDIIEALKKPYKAEKKSLPNDELVSPLPFASTIKLKSRKKVPKNG